jgi:hypothetical protein
MKRIVFYSRKIRLIRLFVLFDLILFFFALQVESFYGLSFVFFDYSVLVRIMVRNHNLWRMIGFFLLS